MCNKTTDKKGTEQVDFAGSDSLLSVAEYSAYPDLQMFPWVFVLLHIESHVCCYCTDAMKCQAGRQAICELAILEEIDQVRLFSKPDTENPNQVAGGIVPVYNLPVLDPKKPEETLVLDRLTLAYIFIGNITQWNDQRILDLQSPAVRAKLEAEATVINVVVRQDRSGSTEVFTKSIDL